MFNRTLGLPPGRALPPVSLFGVVGGNISSGRIAVVPHANGNGSIAHTPDSVQKLQTALHAKAKAEPGYGRSPVTVPKPNRTRRRDSPHRISTDLRHSISRHELRFGSRAVGGRANHNRLKRADSGRRSAPQLTTAMRKYRPFADGLVNWSTRPLAALQVRPMNGQNARESGLRPKPSVAP
jgi:hypothetical protein